MDDLLRYYLAKIDRLNMVKKKMASKAIKKSANNPRYRKGRKNPDVEIVKVVQRNTRGRGTNRNLTETRRLKFDSFRVINERNPADFGLPGCNVWMSALLKHFNEPILTMDNLTNWLERNPHIRNGFRSLIPLGQFGMGVFENDSGSAAERRRGKRTFQDYEEQTNSKRKRIKKEKIPEPELSDYDDNGDAPGCFQPVAAVEVAERQESLPSNSEDESEIDVGQEEEFISAEKDNLSEASFPDDVKVFPSEEGNVSSASSRCSTPDAQEVGTGLEQKSEVEEDWDTYDEEETVVNHRNESRTDSLGEHDYILEEENHQQSEVSSSLATIEPALGQLKFEAPDTTQSNKADDPFIGLQLIPPMEPDPVRRSMPPLIQMKEDGQENELVEADEAYESSDFYQLIFANPADQSDQPDTYTMTFDSRPTISIEELMASDSNDSSKHVLYLMSVLRVHFHANLQQYRHCLPLVDALEFIYLKSNEYQGHFNVPL